MTTYLADFDPAVHIFETCASYKYTDKLPTTGTRLSSNNCCKCMGPLSSTGLPTCGHLSWMNIPDTLFQNILKTDTVVQRPKNNKHHTHHDSLQDSVQLKAAINNPLNLNNMQRTLKQICTGNQGIEHANIPSNPGVVSLLNKAFQDSATFVVPETGEFAEAYKGTSTQPAYMQAPINNHTTSETLADMIYRGVQYYNVQRNSYNKKVADVVATNKKMNAQIRSQQQTIQALQKKVNLAYQVLNAEGTKLNELTKQYSTYRAQTHQSSEERMAIGVPYFKPFFTMTQRNYVIMMMSVTGLLVICIFVYAFVQRKNIPSFHGTSTTKAEPTGTPPPSSTRISRESSVFPNSGTFDDTF